VIIQDQAKNLCYRKVKYVLEGDLQRYVAADFPETDLPFLRIEKTEVPGCSRITVKQGFAWDGASGPCPDRYTMVASCLHDAVYRAMRKGFIPLHFRAEADLMFYQSAKIGGTPRWIAWAAWKTLLLAGQWAIRNPKKTREVEE